MSDWTDNPFAKPGASAPFADPAVSTWKSRSVYAMPALGVPGVQLQKTLAKVVLNIPQVTSAAQPPEYNPFDHSQPVSGFTNKPAAPPRPAAAPGAR